MFHATPAELAGSNRLLRFMLPALAAALAVAAAPARGQEQGGRGAQSAGLEEIVVTARKQEETLQSVPLSITAFTADQIERQRIEGIADIAQFTPGLVYQDINSNLSIPVIRGLAQTNILGSDNNVAMFLNGIYLSNNRTLDIGMIDLQRVEVIKGPQSALYGQNSFAGAINYVTARPTDTPQGELGGTMGGDELYEVRGVVSGPIAGSLAGRASVNWRSFDGTFRNQADGRPLQGYETLGATADLTWEPTDWFSGRVFGYYVDAQNEVPAQYLVPNNCGQTAFGTPSYYCGVLPTGGAFDLTTAGTFGRQAESQIASLDLQFRLSETWSISSITAFVRTESESLLDFDFTSTGVPFPVINLGTGATRLQLANTYLGQGGTRYEDLSQELRLNFGGQRIQGAVGVYWYDSDRRDTSVGSVDARGLATGEVFGSPAPPGFPLPFRPTIATIFASTDPTGAPVLSNLSFDDIETRAAFGRIEGEVLERLRLSAEVRYAEDRKEIERVTSFAAPVTVNPDQSAKFDYVTPRFTADYQWTPDLLLYASFARGVRTGGFNARATRLDEQAFEPERNTTYELGVKSQWLDRRLTFNLATYYIDWTDLQIASRSQDPANIFSIVRNTGDAISSGLEVEIRAALTRGLAAGLGYSYTNPRFKQGAQDLGLAAFCPSSIDPATCPPGFEVDVGGKQLGRTINDQYNAFVQYEGNLPTGWRWYGRADWAHLGSTPMQANNLQFLDSYDVVNARLGIAAGRFEVALWAKNLFDEDYLTAASAQPRFHTGAIADVTFAYGRTYGVTATAFFGR